MKRAIFNPEHDLCLADGSGSFIPPAAIVEFTRKCRWIERFMGDARPDGMPACEDSRPMEEKGNFKPLVFVPWGWNRCLRDKLLKEGVPAELLPDDGQLDFIRESSRRELALELLEYLHRESECPGGVYVGVEDESVAEGHIEEAKVAGTSGCVTVIPANYRIVARSMEDICAFLQERGRVVLKAPLSGSGKGVRFVTGELMETDRGWCKRTLQRQGAVIVEQRMEIIKEFAMLFEVGGIGQAGDGQVKFRGYSLFYSSNGAYKGNLLASNEYIEQELGKYVPLEELRRAQTLVERFLQEKLQGEYVGFVGVDQFVAESSGDEDLLGRKYLWNPAMEINLRMTMGLVARNIYDFHREEYRLGEGTHCFEPERGILKCGCL